MPLTYRSTWRMALLVALTLVFLVVAIVLLLISSKPDTGVYLLMAVAICLFQVLHEAKLPRRPAQ